MSSHRDLEMWKANCFNPDGPLTTKFLLTKKDLPCPKFYGKREDKEKVYHALKEDIHPEVESSWPQLECYCHSIPTLQLSKTARHMNKVFLSCGVAYKSNKYAPCKYFQWIDKPMYTLFQTPHWYLKSSCQPNRYKSRPLKSCTSVKELCIALKENVEHSQQQDKQTQTEPQKSEESNQAWLNQFAESAKKQQET